MARWTETDPGAGDTAAMKTRARAAESVALALDHARTRLDTERAALEPPIWQGAGGDAFQQRAGRCDDDLTSFIRWLTTYGSALMIYANAVESIAEEQAELDTRRETQQLLLSTALTTILSYESGVGTPTAYRRAALDQEDAQTALRRIGEDVAALADRRRTADSALEAELSDVTTGDWLAQGAGLIAAGITDTRDLSMAAIRDALLALSQDVLDGSASEAELHELAALLSDWGNTETLLSAYFQRLGGENTGILINTLGTRYQPNTADGHACTSLALILQTSLSVATRHWTDDIADSFARGLLRVTDCQGVVGFLFGDASHYPMGETLAVSMADAIDQHERIEGRPFGDFTGASGAAALCRVVDRDRLGLIESPMGAVMETLGHYPAAALTWVEQGGDATTGYPRIDYWVRDQDWTTDGYQGACALWSGIQEAPGGPLDATRSSGSTWERLAAVNASFASGLSANPSALPENFSVQGSLALGAAIQKQLPLWAYLAEANPDGESSIEHYSIVGESGLIDRALPGIPRAVINELLGMTCGNPVGASAMAEAIRTTQAAFLGSASQPGGMRADRALTLTAILQAMMDGAQVGAVEGTNVRIQAEIDSALGVVSEIAGSVPIPGTRYVTGKIADGLAGEVGEKIAEWVANQAVERGKGAVTQQAIATIGQAWADSLSGDASESSSRDTLKESLTPWVSALNPSELHTEYGGNLDHYLDALTSHYPDIKDAASIDAGQEAP